VGFTHYYDAGNNKFELGVPCKVTVSNMKLTDEIEGDVPPEPPPPAPKNVLEIYWNGILKSKVELD
jgi:hypothetical protein